MVRRHDVIRAPAEAGPETQAVEHYLRVLGDQLHGPARARTAAIEEIRSGLDDAITAHRTRHGTSATVAAEAAITQLGAPQVVAAAFAGELAVGQTRKALWILLLTGPLVGIWWLLLLATQSGAIQPAIILTAIPALPVVAAAIVIAAIVLATTGSLIRWLPESSPRQAALTAGLIGLGILAVDTTMLAILAARILTGTAGSLSPTLAIIAATVSVIRIPFAAAVSGRCLRTYLRLPPR